MTKKKTAEKKVSAATRRRKDGLHIAFTRPHDEGGDHVAALAEAERSLDEDDAAYSETDTPVSTEEAIDRGFREAGARISTGYSRRYSSNYDAIFGKRN